MTTQLAEFWSASVAVYDTCLAHIPADPENGHQGKRSEKRFVAFRVAEEGPLNEPTSAKGNGLLSVAIGRLPVIVCDWRSKLSMGSCVNDTKTSSHTQVGACTSLKQFGPSQPEIAVLHSHE